MGRHQRRKRNSGQHPRQRGIFFSIASKVGTRVNSLLLKKKLKDMDREKTKDLILPSISGQDSFGQDFSVDIGFTSSNSDQCATDIETEFVHHLRIIKKEMYL